METNHKEFKPFDKVIVRGYKGEVWRPHLYGYWDEKNQLHVSISSLLVIDENILPYEGNEHLVGTTDSPDEEVRLEKDEYIIASDIIYALRIGSGVIGRFVGIKDRMFLKRAFERNDEYRYAIRFSDFNPNDMEETKKHILCVKNGRIVKYKG